MTTTASVLAIHCQRCVEEGSLGWQSVPTPVYLRASAGPLPLVARPGMKPVSAGARSRPASVGQTQTRRGSATQNTHCTVATTSRRDRQERLSNFAASPPPPPPGPGPGPRAESRIKLYMTLDSFGWLVRLPESARFVALGWVGCPDLFSLLSPHPLTHSPTQAPALALALALLLLLLLRRRRRRPDSSVRLSPFSTHLIHHPPSLSLSLSLSPSLAQPPLLLPLPNHLSSLRRPNTRYKRPGHSAPLPPSPPPVSLLTVPGPDAASDRRQGPRAAKKLQVLLPSPICRGLRLASFSIPSPCRGSRSGIVRIICPNSVPCTDFSGIFSKPRFSLPSPDRPTD
ncbi:hypothetical protein IWX92DRAFT_383356 [Phyllosticta citricarpa]